MTDTAQYQCPTCGVDAACNCGVAPVPVGDRVAAFDKATPGQSTRTAGKALGISHEAVRKARNSGVNELTPDPDAKVIGADGKPYPATRPRAATIDQDSDDDNHIASPAPSDDNDDIASPAKIEENFLFALERISENARAFNKILKASALDREGAARINIAVERMMKKWRLFQSTLGKKIAPGSAPAIPPRVVIAPTEERDLKERAKRLGYKTRRCGTQYNLVRDGEDGAGFGGSIEGVTWWLDVIENKTPLQVSTACGIPLYQINGEGEATPALTTSSLNRG